MQYTLYVFFWQSRRKDNYSFNRRWNICHQKMVKVPEQNRNVAKKKSSEQLSQEWGRVRVKNLDWLKLSNPPKKQEFYYSYFFIILRIEEHILTTIAFCYNIILGDLANPGPEQFAPYPLSFTFHDSNLDSNQKSIVYIKKYLHCLHCSLNKLRRSRVKQPVEEGPRKNSP